MLRRCAWVLPASFVLAAAFAGEPAPDVSAAVERARQAWRLGDALERDVRAALSTGSADYAKLLERQDAAYENAQQAFRAALRLAPENPLVLAEFGRFWLSRREPGQA
ncbi:MAG: hypothetical protein NTW87_35560, partial [Planctomycetota bacterium]|nr:hypothetical protein [Planctomycetota bacterium]